MVGHPATNVVEILLHWKVFVKSLRNEYELSLSLLSPSYSLEMASSLECNASGDGTGLVLPELADVLVLRGLLRAVAKPPSQPAQAEQDENREPPGSDDQTVGVRESDVEHRPRERDDGAQNGAAEHEEKQPADATVLPIHRDFSPALRTDVHALGDPASAEGTSN